MPKAKRGAHAALPTYAVIMAGGHGTRFWPRSRRRVPKQLLSIRGPLSMLQETVQRLLPMIPWRRILVVTTAEQVAEVRRQLPRLAAEQVIAEPVGRNTLPCVALAAEWIATREVDALMVVVAADHVIKDAGGLRRTLATACALATQQACLVTIGVEPTRPETGYGYIEVGQAVHADLPGAQWVRRFHEKPALAVARRYVSSRRHLWNSGIFVWRASVFRAAVDACVPVIAKALRGVWQPARGVQPRLRRIYRRLPSVSVDVGIMQPVSLMAAEPRVAVVRAEFDWNDVGSWVSLPEVWGTDDVGNATLGRTVSIDSGGCIVYSPERLVALVGVQDLIVVDSPDALLICARDRAQDVRKVTEVLKARGWSRYL